jgi:hypothetical protein
MKGRSRSMRTRIKEKNVMKKDKKTVRGRWGGDMEENEGNMTRRIIRRERIVRHSKLSRIVSVLFLL